jgi:archaemetzincin
MTGRVLQLVAVGQARPALFKELEEPIALHMQVTAMVGKGALPSPTYAFNKDRNQYHTNAIMRRLAPLLEPPGRFVMGLAEVDLFVPDSPFVFGEADRESKVALISSFRLKGNAPEVLRRRMQIEAVHQTGHLLGLSYCEDPRCVMFLATTPAECDRKSMGPCNVCRNELMKLLR